MSLVSTSVTPNFEIWCLGDNFLSSVGWLVGYGNLFHSLFPKAWHPAYLKQALFHLAFPPLNVLCYIEKKEGAPGRVPRVSCLIILNLPEPWSTCPIGQTREGEPWPGHFGRQGTKTLWRMMKSIWTFMIIYLLSSQKRRSSSTNQYWSNDGSTAK